jgi:hypothetical protein
VWLSAAALLFGAALGAAAPAAARDAADLRIFERDDREGGTHGAPRELRTRYLRRGEPIELQVAAASGAPLPAEAEAHLRWFEVRPLARDYDNARRCHGRPRPACADPIAYAFEEIVAWRGRARVVANAGGTSLGSHRYQVTLGAAPAPEDAAAAVGTLPEIVVRRDDSYVGYLTELVGAPFVLWPMEDQVDERLGADCVALVIYGQRRLGRRVRYVSPTGLKKLTTPVAAGRFARDAGGGTRPAVPVRVGDIVHFGFQTAVLAEDRPPAGTLGENDVVIHSYHGKAEEVPLGTVPYRHFPFEIRRWREGPLTARR